MKLMWMIIFLMLPLIGLTYVLYHVWQLLPLAFGWRWAIVGMGVVLFLTMFLSFSGVIEEMPLNVASALYDVGNSMIFFLLYLVMIFLVLDAARWVHLLPKTCLHDNWYAVIGIIAVMFVIFGYGNCHYHDKYRQELDFRTAKDIKTVAERGKLKIVLLSDLHLGFHNRRAEFAKWVDLINGEHPDLILIGGDIIDISVKPLIEEGVAEEFHRLTVPVYACLGNHEYYSGEPLAQDFYRKAGITLLRDSVAHLDGLCIIGRDDRTHLRRKPLAELMKDVSPKEFTVLLDHQPYHLEEAERQHIDFQFSGHTHNGQVWPASWITHAMYEDAFGPLQKGNTRYYVSSGIGIWGGKYRIGTRSEYVVATIRK